MCLSVGNSIGAAFADTLRLETNPNSLNTYGEGLCTRKGLWRADFLDARGHVAHLHCMYLRCTSSFKFLKRST